MKKNSTAIFLHMEMFVLQDREAWHQLLDLTCVGEGRREWEDETCLYNTANKPFIFFLCFLFGACSSVRLSRSACIIKSVHQAVFLHVWVSLLACTHLCQQAAQ